MLIFDHLFEVIKAHTEVPVTRRYFGINGHSFKSSNYMIRIIVNLLDIYIEHSTLPNVDGGYFELVLARKDFPNHDEEITPNHRPTVSPTRQ